MHIFTRAAFLLLIASTPAFATGTCPTEAMPDECFKAHARVRIEAGKRPMLWWPQAAESFPISSFVSQSPEQYDWPPAVEEMAKPGSDIWGNFTLCPQRDPDEPTARMICINNAQRLRSISGGVGAEDVAE